MSILDVRRVVASECKDEIVTLTSGPLRTPNSNEAIVNISTISLNRGELRRAQSASDGKLQIGWDFVGTLDKPAADGSGPPTGTRVVGFSPRMEGWAEQISIATSYIAPIPASVSNAQAATTPVAGLTALHSVDAGIGILGRKALITGADYDNNLGLLALISYDSDGNQYIILFPNFNPKGKNSFKKFKIPIDKSQMESIKIINKNEFWITSEDEGSGHPTLFKIVVR